ncbi:DnaA regulatory inactivator Hda [Lacimicrobium sp. SS2-24]|uniref:DnaA regulatory inactivator Hda n=1 Tax=Lacimicrobium sp. SS2-24 TaxID=2005569 RepID=UPI000B4B894A|nr:DnaA regulatory inactivator Hda [Lacimicrobium sp. SS2-24]
MISQLYLPVQLPDDENFESFHAGPNAQLISHLKSWFDTSQSPFLTYISGEHGQGKSHLLYSVCNLAADSNKTCAYVGLKNLAELAPEMLSGLEHLDCICLDDIHLLQGQQEWQRAVFDLINRVREQGQCRLAITALQGPKQVPLALADLQSRLSWGVSFHLQPLSDEMRTEVLTSRAYRRGMTMPAEVARFLINHCHRDMPTLMKVLEKLDVSSLQAGHKLTIPFVKKVLKF